MSTAGSVTKWVEELKTGDDAAAQKLWERYCRRLIGLARKKLRGAPHQVADENDVVNDALNSLCLGARAGKFSLLKDRDDLWALLAKITVRKAADLIAYENAGKRKPSISSADSFNDLIQSGPGPATLAIWREEYDRLFQNLGDETLRKIAELSVARCTIKEIADQLGCSRATVNRKLLLIKKILLAEKSS